MKLSNHFQNSIAVIVMAVICAISSNAYEKINSSLDAYEKIYNSLPNFNTSIEIKRLDVAEDNYLLFKFDDGNEKAQWCAVDSLSTYVTKNLIFTKDVADGTFLLAMMKNPKNRKIKEYKPDSEVVRVKVKRGITNFRTVNIESKPIGSKRSDEIKECGNSENIVIPVLLDCDFDGLRDDDEFIVYKSWAGIFDSDGDGIGDGDEALTTHTAPMLYDTDGDGIGDKEDSEPLSPAMMKSFKVWSEHWKSVLLATTHSSTGCESLDSEFADYDRDGKTNYQEFKKGTSPIWGPEVHDAVFSKPYLLSSSKSNVTYTFSMTICSENAVEGLLSCPCSKIEPSFSQTRYQYLPDAVLPDPGDNCESEMFLARYGVPLEWQITIPKTAAGFTFEDMYVMTRRGVMPSMLRICSSKDYADTARNVPQITYPKPGEQIESDTVNFTWEFESKYNVKYALSVISSDGSKNVHQCSSAMYNYPFLKTGNYYCQVSAYDLKKNFLGCSPMVPFKLLASSGNKDSDGDGFSDNQEFLAGSDANSASSSPLRMPVNSIAVSASVGQHLNFRLNALGGNRPLRWVTGDALPDGLRLESAGSIEGTPKVDGTYIITVKAVDTDSHTVSQEIVITISKPGKTEIRPGRGEAGFRTQAID